MRYTVRVAGCHGIPFIYLFTWRIVYPPRYPYIDSTTAVFLSVIFLDWVNSGAPWWSRSLTGLDPVDLIGWMEWI